MTRRRRPTTPFKKRPARASWLYIADAYRARVVEDVCTVLWTCKHEHADQFAALDCAKAHLAEGTTP